MTDQTQPTIYTLEQAARLVQLCTKSLRRAIRDGRLACSRPTGKDIRITSDQLQQWLAATSSTK